MMTRGGEGGKKCPKFDDVICERPLMKLRITSKLQNHRLQHGRNHDYSCLAAKLLSLRFVIVVFSPRPIEATKSEAEVPRQLQFKSLSPKVHNTVMVFID